MVTSPTKTTPSLRILPKWMWWCCFAYIIITIITFIGALPIRYGQLQAIHPAPLDLLQLCIEYVSVIVACVLGLLLVIRRPTEHIAVLFAITIPAGIPNFTGLSHLATELHPLFYPLSGCVLIGFSSLVFLTFISMPDGYPRPRWMVWLIPPFLIYDFARYTIFFVFGSPEIQTLRPVVFIINYLFVFSSMLVMFYRYRYHASQVQRQQLKWLFLGINGSVYLLLIWRVFSFIALRFEGTTQLNPLLGSILVSTSTIILCLCIVFAISRDGLWNIDLSINRSVVAGIMTVALMALFLGIFWLMQTLLKGLLSQDRSEIAIAVAALAIGGVFNPVRLRVQNFVDRKLYGFRFDLNQLHRHKEKLDIKNPGALTGQILGGYELLDVIGRGGMGEVYKGVKDGQVVAIKILQAIHAQDDIMRQRFEREGKIALDHPNIVKTYGAGEENKLFYIIIQYVEGQTLKERLTTRQNTPLSELAPFLRDLANAIDYAHAQGYVHRDIKPSNIMLCLAEDNETQKVMLMDFGIAKILDNTTSLTGSAAVGTIDYMAPEQIQDSTTVDYRADIYALGVVIYEVLSGTLPFKGTPAQVLFAHISQPPPSILSVAPDLPAYIASAIDRALEKKPDNRFQSASEFVQILIGNSA